MAEDFIEDEEKAQKPKKYAEIHVTIWDDGELEMDCVRFKPRESGRGAPRKIIFENKEKFINEVDKCAMSKYGLLKFFREELSLEGDDVKPVVEQKTPRKSEKKDDDTFDDEEDE